MNKCPRNKYKMDPKNSKNIKNISTVVNNKCDHSGFTGIITWEESGMRRSEWVSMLHYMCTSHLFTIKVCLITLKK
jgi:hypothetical protein